MRSGSRPSGARSAARLRDHDSPRLASSQRQLEADLEDVQTAVEGAAVDHREAVVRLPADPVVPVPVETGGELVHAAAVDVPAVEVDPRPARGAFEGAEGPLADVDRTRRLDLAEGGVLAVVGSRLAGQEIRRRRVEA